MRRTLLILLLAASCGGEAATPPAPATPEGPRFETGLIAEVTFEAEEVVSFVLETRAETLDVLIDPTYEYGFNLRHLEQHRVKELPVDVELVTRDGKLYAHEVLDA